MSRQEENNRLWVLTPYHYDSTSPLNSPSREESLDTLRKIGDIVIQPNYSLIASPRFAVVDDGARLKPTEVTADALIHLPENRGKAQAIRIGLRELLKRPDAPEWILQIDADGDQSPFDYPPLFYETQRLAESNPHMPILCVGNRYSGQLVQQPSPFNPIYQNWIEPRQHVGGLVVQHKVREQEKSDSALITDLMDQEYYLWHASAEDPIKTIIYRRAMLLLQRALSIELTRTLQGKNVSWEPSHNSEEEKWKIPDWVSGTRIYNRRFAELFLARSKSENYGIETEQIIIAYLTNTLLFTRGINCSRHRDSNTEEKKLMQNLQAILLHDKELRAGGAGHVVDLLKEIESKFVSGAGEFSISLAPLGHNVQMVFRRDENRVSAEISDDEFIHQLYRGGLAYPWDLVTDDLPT